MMEVIKNCNTCKHKEKGWATKPCDSCSDGRGLNRGLDNYNCWESAENAEVVEEMGNCGICQYNIDRPISKCAECFENSNWAPQDEIVTNGEGGKQSKNEYLWTDFSASALLRVAKLSHAGCRKYGQGNWKKISKLDHIGHAVTHIFKYLSGCKEEDHLAHACWRILAAMGVDDGQI